MTGSAKQPAAAPTAAESAERVGRPRPLDGVDQEILRELHSDGRLSMRALAERVHISRANAYARVSRLLSDGVILGFTTRIDPERAGYETSAYITLRIEQNSWRAVRARLLTLAGVEHVALVSGDFDVVLLVRTANNRALRDLVFTQIQSMPEVRDTRTLLLFDETDREPAPPGG